MPTTRTISDIKAKLLRPASTSHFEVEIPTNWIPDGAGTLKKWKQGDHQDRIQLMCSEASLPGSNLATFEINSDRTGVTEKHVHRRIFDDRIDLTFYVDAGVYRPIRFFEEWIDYITNPAEEGIQIPGALFNKEDSNYFYRMRYPKDYMAEQGLTVKKFEKDVAYGGDGTERGESRQRVAGGGVLEYKFVNAYPFAINSMPVSYETSSLLKCTVSMSYIRYIVNHLSTPRDDAGLTEVKKGRNVDAVSFAKFNSRRLGGDIISAPAPVAAQGALPAAPPPRLKTAVPKMPPPPKMADLGTAVYMGADGIQRDAATGLPI